MPKLTSEQTNVLACDKKDMIISASAGSGKTFILIKYITDLLLDKHIPLRKMLILTFTRAAAGEMRERLNKALLEQDKNDDFVLEQLDDLSIADISTIDAFCEKLIRRNIDKLSLDEGFKLVEDAKIIKYKAFENAISKFSTTNSQMLSEIFASFRKNKDSIFDVLLKLDEFFTYLPSDSLDYFLKNQTEIYNKALGILNEKLKNDLGNLYSRLDAAYQDLAAEPKYQQFDLILKNLMTFQLDDNFEENARNIRLVNLPKVPTVSGENRDENLSNKIKALRASCNAILSFCKNFVFDDKILAEKQRSGSLAVALLSLFKLYKEEYANLKNKLDVLDFVDIEGYAQKLLSDENILSELQQKYDYIFVDEYQDTNRIQESIIKPITQNSHFFAVGDPKQGIYGFRNATMEIMQNDIAEFSQSKQGEAFYLTGNFRSNKNILNFVNKIFVPIMTKESVGIDYKSTSKLKSKTPFKRVDLPAVRVDIVSAEENNAKFEPNGIYSVKKDVVQTKDKDALEVDTIIARIDDLLMSEIYDEKEKQIRRVKFDDIAILVRSRSALVSALSSKLNQKGYPCYADTKESSMNDGQIQMLVNLLKLLLNKKDDISLISVMNSKLGGFDLDELAQMRIDFPDKKYFYEIYLSKMSDPKIKAFDDGINKLKLSSQIKGLTSAMREFFVERDYFAYLKMQDFGKYVKVLGFLNDIKKQGLDFDVAGAISYFERLGGKGKSNLPSGSGIKILTIHASKGLEYPIVILAGCGQKLEKPSMQIYELNKDLGITLPAFNQENNTRCTSPNLEAAKLLNKRKEMIDEIMIFYVALTRAKNHLYIVGQEKTRNLLFDADFNVFKAKNYLSILALAFGRQFMEKLFSSEHEKIGNWEFNIVDSVQSLNVAAEQTKILSIGDDVKSKVEKYLNSGYVGKENCLINIKNTVTALNAHNDLHPVSGGAQNASIDEGNAYHQALKVLNFEEISDDASLMKEIEKNKALIGENYLKLLDFEILLKNILIIKNVVKESKLFKEKPFVMSAKASEIDLGDTNEQVLVQGVVDLFALGENILIDYKYTGQTNDQIVLDRYTKQLDLYSLAIENAFGLKLTRKYILSLKNAHLIEYL